MQEIITLDYGSGGLKTAQLIDQILVPAFVLLYPAVGECSTDNDTQKRRHGYGDGRERTGLRHGHIEILLEERGQPVLGSPSRETGSGEIEQNHPKGDAAEERLQTHPHRFFGRCCRLGHRLLQIHIGLFIPQKEGQHHGIGDADDTEPVESRVPRIGCGHRSTETADSLAGIETRHVNAHCQRARFTRVIIGYERKPRRNIESLAHPHEGPKPENLIEGSGNTHEVGHCRPHEQAAHNEPFAVQPVGDNARHGAHESVNIEEDGHKPTEVGGRLQLDNIDLHGIFHGTQHLPVHIVKQSDTPQKSNNNPRINF